MTTTTNQRQRRPIILTVGCAALLLLVLVQCTTKRYRPAPPARAYVSPYAATVEEAEAKIFGSTMLQYLPKGWGHGTQIEYYDHEGNSYLWYPGNKQIVKGKVEFRGEPQNLQMCFKYGENTYNPLTKSGGGNWKCTSYHNYNFFMSDLQPGDSFNLAASDKVPHILKFEAAKPYVLVKSGIKFPHMTNGKTPIENLQALWGIHTPTSLPKE